MNYTNLYLNQLQLKKRVKDEGEGYQLNIIKYISDEFTEAELSHRNCVFYNPYRI
jgi:hypothetical protein